MTWTTRKPTAPGWYWFKWKTGAIAVVQIVNFYDVLKLVMSNSMFPIDAFNGDFSGPLEPPK